MIAGEKAEKKEREETSRRIPESAGANELKKTREEGDEFAQSSAVLWGGIHLCSPSWGFEIKERESRPEDDAALRRIGLRNVGLNRGGRKRTQEEAANFALLCQTGS